MLIPHLQNLLHRIFERPKGGQCIIEGIDLDQVVHLVAEESYPRIRALPAWKRRLHEPTRTALRHIHHLVEALPAGIRCDPAAFTGDPRVRAFFASPRHMREVFSNSQEVRAFFDADPTADCVWALLCMRKDEQTRLGMALEGGEVRREVLQRTVGFVHHQVMSPGGSEDDARRALKCCIFRSLLAYARKEMERAHRGRAELDARRQGLRHRLAQATPMERPELEGQLGALERSIRDLPAHLDDLDDHLDYVADILSHPETYASAREQTLCMDGLGVVSGDCSRGSAHAVTLSEIHVAGHRPRISVLAAFPRDQLLPETDYLERASLFLAV